MPIETKTIKLREPCSLSCPCTCTSLVYWLTGWFLCIIKYISRYRCDCDFDVSVLCFSANYSISWNFLSKQAYAAGCNIVILASTFERVQIIPGAVHNYVRISCVDCSTDTGKIAAAYDNRICIFEPTPLIYSNSSHVRSLVPRKNDKTLLFWLTELHIYCSN